MSLKDQPRFRTVRSPESYERTTSGAVRYVPVLMGEAVVGYLWAAVAGDAAGFVRRESGGDVAANAAVAWVRRLRWAKAGGLTPVRALRHWAGQDEDERAGRVPADAESELPALRELQDLAAAE
ncbi:hypothetical protein FAF44_11390 [Nonomuraea sp. MG754425]|uniref:hypothetical protein n=1 Tax=Nonomuraea sp. MG754425 TaxID=2570319 RepID=UPI001F316889|nr:hypothetical protein [Nonomuraea sp. MG754425]MCF6468987.1 hypothetical protein [Nonomuraea sp. MG754425]